MYKHLGEILDLTEKKRNNHKNALTQIFFSPLISV